MPLHPFHSSNIWRLFLGWSSSTQEVKCLRFMCSKQKNWRLEVSFIRCLHAKYEGRWHFLEGGGGGGVFLCGLAVLSHVNVSVLYKHRFFPPCIPAIDTWIYHVNCWSQPGQGFMHWSMRHREEDKETVQTPFWLEEDEFYNALVFLRAENRNLKVLSSLRQIRWLSLEFLSTRFTRNVHFYIMLEHSSQEKEDFYPRHQTK